MACNNHIQMVFFGLFSMVVAEMHADKGINPALRDALEDILRAFGSPCHVDKNLARPLLFVSRDTIKIPVKEIKNVQYLHIYGYQYNPDFYYTVTVFNDGLNRCYVLERGDTSISCV